MPSSSSSMAAALLLLLIMAAAFAPSSASSRDLLTDDDDDQLLMMGRFHGWMAAHGRSYGTAEEKLRRFEIYRENMEFIEEANRDGRLSYRLGETPFTDLTHDEFFAMYTNHVDVPTADEEEEVITTRAGHVREGGVEEPRRNLTAVLPETVDWRVGGYVSPAKYQGTCSACWAFVTVSTIESAYAIKNGVLPPPLSEQQLVDCDRYDAGCRSGWMHNAFRWVTENGGITTAADYPFTESRGACDASKLTHHAVTISGHVMVKPRDERALMEAVAAQPVGVSFDDADPCFQHYIDGVYDGKCFKSGVYIGPCFTSTKHALAIVGYGTTADGVKYWIAKNSWSHKWGDNGFVYLQKDVPSAWGLCGLAQKPSYPVM